MTFEKSYTCMQDMALVSRGLKRARTDDDQPSMMCPMMINPQQNGGASVNTWPRKLMRKDADAVQEDCHPQHRRCTTSIEYYLNTPIIQEFASLKLTAASSYIPKENPLNSRGDDAHFICKEKQTIGLADGVGGWTKFGVDGGEYARQLMFNSFLEVLKEPNINGTTIINPKRVLQEAYINTKVEGSSTACIITLSGNRLHAANVGDSGFLLFRDGNLVYQSPIQQKKFNCPYQLGMHKDNPSIADEFELEVKSGDLIVAGTDGLLDNMYANDIVEIMNKEELGGINDLEEKAHYIANLALYNSFDKYSHTPYSMASRKAGKNHRGGKIDDITVIVARINSSPSPPSCNGLYIYSPVFT